ncbi:MAG: hypothetical protein RLO52_41610 [Sandaracinaceae bacterium]
MSEPLPVIAAEPYAAPPMSAEPPSSLTRHALIPTSIAVCFTLVYGVEAAPWWVIVIGAPALLLYLGAPTIGRRSLARFDRDAVRLLSGGQRRRLPRRYARALGMRLFAPPALVAERRGLVHAETGAPGPARAAYREALDGYPEDAAPIGVMLGLAHASFALGDSADAIARYRAVWRRSKTFPRVAKNLAHALARKGEDLAEAETLAERALADAPEPPPAELSLVRALVHAKRGQRGPARKLLKRARAHEDAARLEELVEEVETALEEL